MARGRSYDVRPVIGNVAIMSFGRPPLVSPCDVFRLGGVALKLLNALDQVGGAGRVGWPDRRAESSRSE
jgi:hypothetical protein